MNISREQFTSSLLLLGFKATSSPYSASITPKWRWMTSREPYRTGAIEVEENVRGGVVYVSHNGLTIPNWRSFTDYQQALEHIVKLTESIKE